MVCVNEDNYKYDDSICIEEDNINITRKGGRCLIDKPTLFSHDQSSLFVISGHSILVYSVSSCEYVKTLKDEDNLNPLISLYCPEWDDRSLITCSEDGYVVTWKYHAGVQSTKTKLKLPTNGQVLNFNVIDEQEAFVVCSINGLIGLSLYDLKNGNLINNIQIPQIRNGLRWFVDISHHDNTPIAAIANDCSSLHVVKLKNPNVQKFFHVPGGFAICSLCWHPSQDVLAVGDALGRIILFRSCLGGNTPAKEIKHWHHLPLACLVFSKQGGVLLSGGAERVVVAWGNKNSKTFIPRLPAEILHISASKSHIAVSTADNAIQIVDSGTLYTVGCIKEAGGLGGKQSLSNKLGAALQYAHPVNSLILPAGPGHLHIYSTQTDKLIYTLDVTNTNIVPPERENLHPEQIEVNLMSVGCHGQWLCTWEGRSEQERIKWWECLPNGWTLHTVAARPHRPANPAALQLASDVPVALSLDQNNVIRFWNVLDSVPGHEGKSAWCTTGKTTGGNETAGGACLSADGSIAASWCGARLELWDTRKAIQKTSLAHPALRPQGRLVQFGRNHHMHFIVCTTDDCLAVWNCLTLRLAWIVKLDTTCLISDPFSDRIATITSNNDVFVFKLNSPHPLATIKNALPPKRGRITSAAFAPSSTGPTDFKLYCLREQSEIFLIENSKTTEDSSVKLEQLPGHLKPHSSAYSAFVASKTVTSSTDSREPRLNKHSSRPQKALLNDLLLTAPSHTQPSLKNICGSVFGALIGTSNNSSNSKIQEDFQKKEAVKDEDVEMENIIKQDNGVSLRKLEKESLDWVKELLENDGLTIPHLEYEILPPTSPERLSLLGFKLSILLN